MAGIITLFISLIFFFIVIFVHELGHFIAAKLSGIYVEEFSIGMGPMVFSKEINSTQYSARLFPIGGYVSMENIEIDNGSSFNEAPVYKRIIVILAGAFMNFFLALLLFFIIGLFIGSPTNQVYGTVDNSPADGLLENGDIIISVNGNYSNSWNDTVNYIDESGRVVDFLIERNGQILSIEIVKDDDEDSLGIYASRQRSIVGSLKYSFQLFIDIILSLIYFLIGIFHDGIKLNSISGPIGIISSINHASRSGIIYLLFFLAYISINVGFFNLLPIPALDGWKFSLLLIESLSGRSMTAQMESFINLIGFCLLLFIIIFLTINDIIKLR